MILTPKILLRMAAIGLVTVLLQVTFFSRVVLIGSSPDLAVLVVVAFGLLGGVVIGSVTGFTLGTLIDALAGAPLGSTGLAFILAGYLAGSYRERSRREAGPLAIPAIGLLITLAAALSLLLVHLLLGMSGSIGPSVVWDLLVRALYALALAAPVYVAIRRLLRPALIEEAPFQRRRGKRSSRSVLQS